VGSQDFTLDIGLTFFVAAGLKELDCTHFQSIKQSTKCYYKERRKEGKEVVICSPYLEHTGNAVCMTNDETIR